MELVKCDFCDKEFSKYGIKAHIWRTHTEEGKVFKPTPNGTKGSNQYIKAKEMCLPKPIMSDETRKKLSNSAKKQMTDFFSNDENRNLWSDKMIKAVDEHKESYTKYNISGRVKMYEISNTTVKGSWELLVAEKLNDANIDWTNDIDGIEYIWENKNRKYFPDFYLKDLDLYIEVKGYERERDLAKWSVVKNLVILKEKEIKLLQNGEDITKLLVCTRIG